jgi:sortase A
MTRADTSTTTGGPSAVADGYQDDWQPRRPSGGPGVARQVAGGALVTLSVCLIGFIVWLAFGSKLYYDRVQHDTYSIFRGPLALGTAPTGPTDPFHPEKLLALGTPVAVLEIPGIKLRAVVLEGTTGQVLEGGPGHLRDTSMPGQQGVSVILGRRAAYGGPFSLLSSLQPGDPITVTTGQGTSRYQVTDLRRPGDPTPQPVAAGGGRLIMVTADGTPFAPSGQLYVDADLASKPFDTPAMILSAQNLLPAENAMGTDSRAWVPLVLWGILLLLAASAASWLSRSWGRWQTWLIAVPVLGYLALVVADEVTRLLPNVM